MKDDPNIKLLLEAEYILNQIDNKTVTYEQLERLEDIIGTLEVERITKVLHNK
jgi:hypothetical protein